MVMADFIFANRIWDLDKITYIFLKEMMNQIKNIPISQGFWQDQ